ncbi:alpha/beta hydrolase [Streptomyces sp. NPDC056519]|uniref:alpha/beta hydrolase n=1 Tax=Streptomyces sp. NPDC056519 TaxID=3345849 RepID=UPI00367C0E27
MDGEPAYDNGMAVNWAVMCGDVEWPHDTEQYAKDAARDKEAHPIRGDIASTIKPCAFWDKPAEPATVMDQRAPNVLVVQNEWDPQTPLSSGEGLHRALKDSSMVTVAAGYTHIVYTRKDNCAMAPVTEFLTTGRLPDKNLTCTNPDSDTAP